jgi:hypothetical protein
MWADWLRNYIPREKLEHHIHSTVVFPDKKEEIYYRRAGDPHVRKVRCVCGPCNNGWMSQIQENTKICLVPMLRGSEARLHKRAQTFLASWATMMVMVSEYLDRGKVAVPTTDRRWFFNKKCPPSHWRIWIGRHNRQTYSLWTHNVMTLVEEKGKVIPDDLLPKANTQTSTILLGKHLIIHVMSSPIARHIIRRWKLPPKIAPSMSQIWPVQQSWVSWPVGDALTDADIHLVADQLFDRVHAQMRRRSAGLL